MKSHNYAESVALDILSKTPSSSFVIASRRLSYHARLWTMLEATYDAEDNDYSISTVFRDRQWAEVKDKVIEFFCQKPEFEREFLRAKSEETLTAPRVLEAL